MDASAFPTNRRLADGALYGRRERLALVAGALLMLLIVTASGLIARRTEADLADAETARATRSLSVELMEAVTAAETSQRGYLLTGQRDYLQPYLQAHTRVPALLERLGASIGGDPDFRNWRQAIETKMAELARTVQLEETGQHQAALAEVLTGRGRDAMEVATAISNRLGTAQRAVVARDLQRSRDGARQLVWVDAVALLMLLLLAAFVGRSLRATVNALSQSRRSLADANAALQRGRDELEAAVAERTAELTDANSEIQRFAYIVSHDLRAPLLNIIGFTSELDNATQRLNRFVAENLEPAGIAVPPDVREASREDLPEAIRFIQTSTAKMDRLITAILRLSREGRRVLTPERLDMAKLLAGVFDSMRHQADAGGASLSLGPTPPLVSDRIAIEQVFSNLVENALKYPSPGRPVSVDITGSRAGASLRYEVRDNGRGIAERDRERIFELFRRAGPQDTTGEGIGLAHVRTLLRRLGGTIECESSPGVGSTFIVTLPAVLAPASATMLERGTGTAMLRRGAEVE